MTSDAGADREPPPPDGRDTSPPQWPPRPAPYAPPGGVPAGPAAPGWANPPPPRPRPLSIASGLWIALGVIFTLGTVGYLAKPQSVGLTGGPLIPAVLIAMGVAFIALASRLRRGRRDTRTALTVLGAITLIGMWTIVLVVPAIVLQYRPDSTAWLHAVGPRRAGRQPSAPGR